jgi:MutS domain V
VPATPPPQDVDHEYQARLDVWRAALAIHERRNLALARLRLAIVCATMLMALVWGTSAGWWYGVPAMAFLAAAVVHAIVLKTRGRAARAVRFYERGLARIDHAWMGTGDTGDRYRQPDHPYADDLDLFGRGSAFELLGTARTGAGQDVLAGWLLAGAPLDQVLARQRAAQELRPRLDLREALALEGDADGPAVDAARLRRWAGAPPALRSRPLRLVFAALGAAVAATAIVWLETRAATTLDRALLILLLAEAAIAWPLRAAVKTVVRDVALPAGDLTLLAGVLRIIEREPVAADRLLQLQRDLGGGRRPASAEIARLDRLVGILQSRANLLVALLGPAVALTTQTAFAIEAWRSRVGADVPRWLDAVGEFEALAAVGGYAAEHRGSVFPDLAAGPALIEAADLAHPLLPGTAVPNDIAVGGAAPHLLVVSGSNMSGKSTLLRAVGLNVVLAQAGAPVRASRFRLSVPLAIGASIRIQDSLTEGRSRFLAEILRLKQIVELTRSRDGALLFLLDEILGGTNSHDRRTGAEAVLDGLTKFGAIGFVTTHDLTLGAIVDRLAPLAANVHFADVLDGGGLHFDYRMRPGIVRTSNALALMRSIGLDVTTPA